MQEESEHKDSEGKILILRYDSKGHTLILANVCPLQADDPSFFNNLPSKLDAMGNYPGREFKFSLWFLSQMNLIVWTPG